MRAITLMVLLGATQVAAAQIGLPAVRLPNLPAVGLPGSVGQDLLSGNGQGADLDVRTRRELRQARIRELLRRHADVLEADPHGDPIVRGQVLLLSPDGAALEAAAAAGFTEVGGGLFGAVGGWSVGFYTHKQTTTGLTAL
jgi:hypothetical protein